MSISSQTRKRIEDNWFLASKRLDFEVVCPFKLTFKGKEKVVFAFLPAYGSENGVIVDLITPPEFQTDPEIIEWAQEQGCYYSFLNVESLVNYDEDYFIRTLQDWGRYQG